MAEGKTVQNKEYFSENPSLLAVSYIKNLCHADNLNCEYLIGKDQLPSGNVDPNQLGI